jgi:transcriptional regulator with XRE-family HTH domain
MMPAMDEWRRALREARERLGLSRDEAARLSGVSMNTVKSYELGRRRPLRHHLGAVLTAYRLNREEQRPILEGAGFVANDGWEGDGSGHLWHSAEEAEAEVQRHDWPAFVLDEFVRVVAANDAAQRLWGVDLRHEFTSSVDRNLLSVASNPRFADRCVNWDKWSASSRRYSRRTTGRRSALSSRGRTSRRCSISSCGATSSTSRASSRPGT